MRLTDGEVTKIADDAGDGIRRHLNLTLDAERVRSMATEMLELRAALKPFAELGDAMLPQDANDTSPWALADDTTPVRDVSAHGFTFADFRRARKALETP